MFTDEEPNWTTGVWIMDLTSKRVSRLTNLAHGCFHPVWSSDGNEIIYANGNEQGMKLLRQAITSAEPITLLDTAGPKFPTDWSADGRFVTYFTPWPDFVRLRTVLLDIKNATSRILLESHYNEAEAVLCPEKAGPRWLAYVSTETGRPEVYVRSFPDPGQKVQISDGGGWQPIWRKDAHELFYLSSEGVLMAVDVTIGKQFRAELPHPLFRTNIRPYPGRPELPANSYAVSKDGQRFLVNQGIDEAARNTISVVTHWQAIRP